MKGLICSILKRKNFPDCSLNGISNQYNEVLLIGSGVPEIFEPNGRPVVKIENHYRHYMRAVQFGRNSNMFAMGGCFIWTSDSRFPFDYPIPLHDRDMTKEERTI